MQHGLITRNQLRAVGLRRGAIAHRVDSGLLWPQHREVWSVGHPHLSAEGRLLAAVGALGSDAVVSHFAAAWLWGIVSDVVAPEVTVPTYDGVRHRDGITVHRQNLPDGHVTVLGAFPITTLIRTILDLAGRLQVWELRKVFQEAQVRHKLQPDTLAAEVVMRRGYRGTARLRQVLEGAVDPGQVESILELLFLEFCKAYGFERPLQQVRFGPWRVDFLFRDEGVVVETDSRWHDTPTRKRDDDRKTAYLQARGLVVHRLRWTDVVDNPYPTAVQLRELLHARRLRPRT